MAGDRNQCLRPNELAHELHAKIVERVVRVALRVRGPNLAIRAGLPQPNSQVIPEGLVKPCYTLVRAGKGFGVQNHARGADHQAQVQAISTTGRHVSSR